jgi:hypothetical protein
MGQSGWEYVFQWLTEPCTSRSGARAHRSQGYFAVAVTEGHCGGAERARARSTTPVSTIVSVGDGEWLNIIVDTDGNAGGCPDPLSRGFSFDLTVEKIP